MTESANDFVSRLVGLIPSGDDSAMWREHYAQIFEGAEETDDLSLLRAGKQAYAFEADFQAFANGFQG